MGFKRGIERLCWMNLAERFVVRHGAIIIYALPQGWAAKVAHAWVNVLETKVERSVDNEGNHEVENQMSNHHRQGYAPRSSIKQGKLKGLSVGDKQQQQQGTTTGCDLSKEKKGKYLCDHWMNINCTPADEGLRLSIIFVFMRNSKKAQTQASTQTERQTDGRTGRQTCRQGRKGREGQKERERKKQPIQSRAIKMRR